MVGLEGEIKEMREELGRLNDKGNDKGNDREMLEEKGGKIASKLVDDNNNNDNIH